MSMLLMFLQGGPQPVINEIIIPVTHLFSAIYKGYLNISLHL